MKRGCTPSAGDADVGRGAGLMRELGIVAVKLDQGLDMLGDEGDRVDHHANAVGGRRGWISSMVEGPIHFIGPTRLW